MRTFLYFLLKNTGIYTLEEEKCKEDFYLAINRWIDTHPKAFPNAKNISGHISTKIEKADTCSDYISVPIKDELGNQYSVMQIYGWQRKQ